MKLDVVGLEELMPEQTALIERARRALVPIHCAFTHHKNGSAKTYYGRAVVYHDSHFDPPLRLDVLACDEEDSTSWCAVIIRCWRLCDGLFCGERDVFVASALNELSRAIGRTGRYIERHGARYA